MAQPSPGLRTSARRLPDLTGYVLALPALILVTVFVGIPFMVGIWVSLTSATAGSFSGAYVGLSNYAKMLTDTAWHEALMNAVRALAVLPIMVMFPLILAFALHQGVRFGGFFRATYFLAWLLPPVMVGYMFIPILATSGPLNSLLGMLGLAGLAETSWLGSSDTALWTVLAIVVWSTFGFGVGVYLAGLSTISEDLFDAAKVDGAGFWRTLVAVTIPSILPTMAFLTVISTGGLLLWLFPFVYSLTGGGPGRATTFPEFYVWSIFGGGNLGYAAALGIALLAMVFILVLFQVRLMFFRGAEE